MGGWGVGGYAGSRQCRGTSLNSLAFPPSTLSPPPTPLVLTAHRQGIQNYRTNGLCRSMVLCGQLGPDSFVRELLISERECSGSSPASQESRPAGLQTQRGCGSPGTMPRPREASLCHGHGLKVCQTGPGQGGPGQGTATVCPGWAPWVGSEG